MDKTPPETQLTTTVDKTPSKMQFTTTVDKTPSKMQLTTTVDKTPSKMQLTTTVGRTLAAFHTSVHDQLIGLIPLEAGPINRLHAKDHLNMRI